MRIRIHNTAFIIVLRGWLVGWLIDWLMLARVPSPPPALYGLRHLNSGNNPLSFFLVSQMFTDLQPKIEIRIIS